MNTISIALLWQDFFSSTYKDPLSYEQEREYQLLFFTGFYACINALNALADSTDEEQHEAIYRLVHEYRAFAHAYIVDRVRDVQ